MYRNFFWYSLEEIELKESESKLKDIEAPNGEKINELNHELSEKENMTNSSPSIDTNVEN